MQYFKLALPLALASSAFANPLLRRDACTSNACIAAVTGKAALGDDGLRADHCKSFLATTVTPEAITETTTITGVEPSSAWGAWKRSKVTVCPNEVPNYASACETAAYSSACSCFGYSGDSTTTLKPTTTTKTVYVSATGVCTGGTATKTVTVTVPSGSFSTLSGVFTSTVYETKSVCPTPSGLSSTTSTRSTSTYTTTSAVTSTVTTTVSGSTCPTTSATTSTVTVSGTTSTVTVSGTTSVITTTASATTCPTTSATTSTVTVSGTTSTVTVSGTTSVITTTASASTCPTTTATTSTVTVSGSTSTSTVTTTASTCPTTTATTSTVTVSGTTSTVTTTESASSCPTTSATTTTVTTTETTTSTTTTSSAAAAPTCLTQDQADSFVAAFTNFLENTDVGAQYHLSDPYNTDLAMQTFTQDFQDYSDSINYMANFPLGGVTFDGVYAFNYGQGSLQFPVYVITENTWLSCTSFTWKYKLITGLGEDRPISGINVFELTDDLTQIKTNYAEFNNAAWLANIAEAQAAQAAAAAAAATTTSAATTTTDAATTSTTDAVTTTSSSPPTRKMY